MLGAHFYHATLRKVIASFGTIFNNIHVVRKDQTGKVINIQRVPLAYGPKQKYLARIDEQPNPDGTRVAIKLPRMSFEITTMVYDAQSKINRNQRISVATSGDPLSKTTVNTFSPYRLGIQLSIMAKNQDDALQCIEQILPYFQPEYTITVKDVEGMNIANDIPIVLTNVTLPEDYEGDFTNARTIVYTLDFELRVRFFGPVTDRGIIKSIITDFIDIDGNATGQVSVAVDPKTATESDDYNIVVNISEFISNTTSFYITVLSASGSPAFAVNDEILDADTGTVATIKSIAGNILRVEGADGIFRVGDTVSNSDGATGNISTVVPTLS